MKTAIPAAVPASPEPLSDGELAQRVAGGDVRAFEALMRRHNRTLFRTSRAILRDDADAEESAQVAVLQRLLGIGVVAENGARSPEQRPVVAPHRRLEGAHAAAGDTLRELAVGKRLRAGWDCGGGGGF